MPSVRHSMSEMSVGDADTSDGIAKIVNNMGGFIHSVEPLKPRLAIDEIQTLARRGPEIADDEIDLASFAVNRSVQRPRPKLRVCRELEFGLRKSNQLRRSKKRLSQLLTPPMVKKRLFSFEKCLEAIVNSPVCLSSVEPVAFLYFQNASSARRRRVVPAHTLSGCDIVSELIGPTSINDSTSG